MADGKVVIKIDGDDSGFKNSVSSLGKVATAGLAAATAAAAGLTAGFVAAVKVGAAFEAQMSTVGSISGASAEEMAQLTAKAEEMGAKTAFSAAEAGKAFEYMAMAGWKTEEMLSGVSGIMNLAAASGEDLGMVADIVTDGLTAFGLSADQSARFSDVLAASASNSNTNVSMLGESFKYVAPVAGALGYSIEDTATALGLMANAGIKGSQAGTALRSTMSRLTKPTEDVQVALNKLNISMTDSNGKVKPLDTLIGELRTSFSGLTEAEKAQYAATIAGQEGMSGLLAIVNASETDFNKLKSAIENSAGEAEKMAEIRMDNLQGQVTLLKSSLEGTGIAVYKKFAEPMKNGVKSAIVSVNSLTSSITKGGLGTALEGLGKQVGNLIADFARFATKALPPLINGFTFLIKNIGTLTKTVVAAVAAFKTFSIVKTVATFLKTASAASTAYAAATAAAAAGSTAAASAQVFMLSSMSASEVVVGLLTGKITLATAAQWLWNAAISANPIVLAIAAVSALAVGIGILIATSNKMTEEERARQEAMQKTAEVANEVTEALEQQKEAYQSNIDTIQQSAEANIIELDRTKLLADELGNLVDENGNVTEGNKKRAEVILNELNNALGTEYKLTGDTIKNYDKLTDEVYKLIEAEKARAVVAAYGEMYQAAVKKESEAKRNAVEASEKLNTAQSQLNDTVENARQYLQSYSGVSVTTEQAIDALNKGSFEYISNMRGMKVSTKDLQPEFQKNTEYVNQLNNAIKYAGEASVETSEIMMQWTEAQVAHAEGRNDDLINSTLTTAKTRKAIETKNAEEIYNLIEQNNAEIQVLEQFKNDNMTEAQRAGYTQRLEELQRSNEELYNTLNQANNAIIEQENQANTTKSNNLLTALEADLQTVQGNKEAQQKVINDHYTNALVQLDDYAAKYKSGTDGYTSEGLMSLTNNVIAMEQTYGSGMGGLIRKLQYYGDEYSKKTDGFSKDGKEKLKKNVIDMAVSYGYKMDEIVDKTGELRPEFISKFDSAGTGGTNSLIGAIQGKLNQVGQASKGLAEIAEREYKNNINGDKLGSDTGAGVSGGLLSTIGAVGQAAKKVAEAAQKAYKDAQWQASPSKKFRQFGRFDVEGVILGYKDKLDDVESAAEEIAEAGRKPFEEQPEFSMDNIIIPEKFFGMGEDSAAEFARGFKDNLSDLMADVQLKIQSRLSAITPQVAYVGGASGNSNITYKTTTNSPTLIFNKQVDSPDVVAREVNKIFTFGLAGDR